MVWCTLRLLFQHLAIAMVVHHCSHHHQHQTSVLDMDKAQEVVGMVDIKLMMDEELMVEETKQDVAEVE